MVFSSSCQNNALKISIVGKKAIVGRETEWTKILFYFRVDEGF